MRRFTLLTLFLAAVAALAGCSSDAEAAAGDLVGTWVSSDGVTWELTDDLITAVLDGEVVIESRYTATDTTLEMVDETPGFCPQSQPGTYDWKIDEDVLSLTVVSDECNRKGALDGISFERAE